MDGNTPPRGVWAIQPGKKKAIINWINSIGLAECIDSIHQLRDGRHLCQILSAIDQDIHVDGTESLEDRIRQIKAFLEAQYKTPIDGKIKFQNVVNGDEFEIGKLSLLLLCAGLICTGNELFVESAVKLDTDDQLEIRDMAGTILTPNNDLECIEGDWYSVLTRAADFTVDAPPRTPTHTGMTTFSSSMMQASADSSVLSRFASPSVSRYTTPNNGSPVMQLVRSPTVANRILMQRKDQKIKQLMRELNSEKHLRSEFESEVKILKEQTIQEKENLIHKLEGRIKVLRRQTLDLQVQADQVDDFEKEKEELTETLEFKSSKLKDMKEQAEQLQKENEELYDEINKLKETAQKHESLRAEYMKMKNDNVALEGSITEIRLKLNASREETQIIRESYENLQCEMENLQELRRAELESNKKGNETGNISMAGECLNGVLEKELKEQIEDLEEEISCLKAQLVSQLQKHKMEKQSMENKMIQKQEEMQRYVRDLQQQMETQSHRASTYHSEFVAKSEELEEMKRLLETENIQLQNALEDIRDKSNESSKSLQELTSRHKALLEENDNLRSNLENVKEEFNSQVDAMMEQRDRLHSELTDRDKALDEHIETSHHKSMMIEELQKMNEKLEADIETFSQRVEEMQDNIDALEEERDDLKLKTDEQMEKLQEFQQMVDISDSERTEWQQKALELEERISMNGESSNEKIKKFEVELKQARDRNAYFENLVGNFESKVCQLEAGFKAEIEKAEKGKENLSKELTSSKARAEKMQEAFELSKKKIADMEKRMGFYHEAVVKLEEEMRKCQAESEATQSSLRNELAAAQKKVEDMDIVMGKTKKERKTLIHEYEEEKARAVKLEQALIQTEDQVQDLEDELRTTKCTMTNLQESLNNTTAQAYEKDSHYQGELKAAHARENQLQQELDQAQAFVDEVKAELKELQRNLPTDAVSGREIKHLKRKLEDSNKERETLKKKCDELSKDKTAQQEYLESSQENVTKVWNELQESQKQLKELKASLESSQADNSKLWNELSESKKEQEALNSQHSTDRSRIVTLEGYLQTSEEHNAVLEAKLAKSREEVSHLEENIENTMNRAAKFEEEVANVKSAAAEVEKQLKEELKEAYAKEQELEEVNDKAQDAVTELEEKIDEILAESNKYEDEIESLKKQLEEKEKHVASTELHLKESMENAKLSANQLEGRLMEQLKDAQEKEKELNAAVEKSHAVIVELEKTVKEMTTSEETTSSEKDRLSQAVSEKERAISSMEHQLREAISRSSNIEKDMMASNEEISRELKAAKASFVEVEQIFKESEEKHAKQVENMESKIGELEFELLAARSEASEKTKELEDAMHSFKFSKEELLHRVTSTQSTLEQQSILVQKLQQQTESDTQNIASLKSQLVTSRSEVSSLESQINSYKTQVATVTQSMEATSNLTSKFRAQLQEKERACKELQEETNKYKKQLKGVDAELRKLKNMSDVNLRAGGFQGAISELHDQLHEKEEAYRQLEENSKKECDQLRLKVQASESNLQDLQGQLNEDSKTKQAKLKKKVEELTARCTQMEEGHKKQLSKLEVDFTTQFQKEANKWKENHEQLAASLKRSRERLDGKEKEYNHLKSLADSFKTDSSAKTKLIEDQTAELNAMRLKIADLEAQIAELQKNRIPRTRSSTSLAPPAQHQDVFQAPPSPCGSTISALSTGSRNQYRVPQGIGGMFEADEEPELMPEFGGLSELHRRQTTHGGNNCPAFRYGDNGRLTELQRRNTLCLPHLKTSYPVETQTRALRICTDDKLKTGSPIVDEPTSAGPVTRSRSASGSSMASTRASSKEHTPIATDPSVAASKGRKRKSIVAGIGGDHTPEGPSEKRLNPDPNVIKLSTPGVNMYKAYSPRTRAQMRAAGLLDSGQKPGPAATPVTPGLTGFSDLTINSPLVHRKSRPPSPSGGASVKSVKLSSDKKSQSKENMTFSIGFTPLQSARKLGRKIMSKKLRKGSKSKPLGDNNVASAGK